LWPQRFAIRQGSSYDKRLPWKGKALVSAPNPTRQRAALTALDRLFADAANVWIIHYSCESFYDPPEGRSPRVTSVAVRKLDSGQTVSFSIHQVAERRQIRFDQIEQHYDDLEREMLTAFFGHLGTIAA
jgi:hypothetical protein